MKVLVPGYSARQDARSPVRYGVVAVAANIVLSFALAPWLAHAGLALATALAALLNSGLLLRKLLKDGVYQPAPGWGEFFGRMAVANAAMGLWLFRWADRGEWAGWDKAERAGHLLLWVVAGAAFTACACGFAACGRVICPCAAARHRPIWLARW